MTNLKAGKLMQENMARILKALLLMTNNKFITKSWCYWMTMINGLV